MAHPQDWQFSIRTLLVLTTLCAFVAAVYVWPASTVLYTFVVALAALVGWVVLALVGRRLKFGGLERAAVWFAVGTWAFLMCALLGLMIRR